MDLSKGNPPLATHNPSSDSPLLVIDFENKAEVPPNFRSTRDPYKAEVASPPTRYGLDALNASACQQFSELDLEATLRRVSGDVYIVDLRQEPHGFISGLPVSWYGLRNQTHAGKSSDAIEALEQQLLAEVGSTSSVPVHEIVHKINGRISESLVHQVRVGRVETERDLVERMGLKYVRFFVTDHLHPDEQCIDQFIHFVRGLPEDAWLHFHCRSGLGRTSTFMVLYDIVRNAASVSLDDIIQRQALIGSKNLFQIADSPDKLWRYEMGARRREFIKAFYAYMKDPQREGMSAWSEWRSSHNLAG